jgi:hypothetical protein
MEKYSIYIICKDEEIFNEKKRIFKEQLNIIDNFYFIQSVYLTISENNGDILNKLKTRYNTKSNKILSKLGCISAHKNALLMITNNNTKNNIILEEDFNLNNKLPNPPKISCYLGGWIVSLKMKDINKKIKINNLKNGINNINYENFRILTTHAYYIKNVTEATLLLIDILTKNKIKNYDIYLSDNKIINNYYYPEIFIQSKHKSEIDGKINKNHKNTLKYGL